MRILLTAFALLSLTACVAPGYDHDNFRGHHGAPYRDHDRDSQGNYRRVFAVDDMRFNRVPDADGVYEVSVRGTTDGRGWRDPELRLVDSPAGHPGEIVLVLVALPPEDGFGHDGYDGHDGHGHDHDGYDRDGHDHDEHVADRRYDDDGRDGDHRHHDDSGYGEPRYIDPTYPSNYDRGHFARDGVYASDRTYARSGDGEVVVARFLIDSHEGRRTIRILSNTNEISADIRDPRYGWYQ